MKFAHLLLFLFCMVSSLAGADEVGPDAALRFAESYRGEKVVPDAMHCYPDARGIPFSAASNITEMRAELWRPADILADFTRRMEALPAGERKKGIIVFLKTERCATKASRLCSITTAAFAKEATPLVREFALYGVQLKPRDGDDPPGSLAIEEGADAWKNAAAGEYGFRQGPGTAIVVLSPVDGSRVQASDASRLKLVQQQFVKNKGSTPELENFLRSALRKLQSMQP